MNPRPFRGNNNNEVVNYLKERGWIISDLVYRLMSSVDRQIFCIKPEEAYVDAPQYTANNKCLSSPHMLAVILEFFRDKLENAKRALHTGCGTGYLTTCMALAIGEDATVVGLDTKNEHIAMAMGIMHKHYRGPLEERIHYSVGNSRSGNPQLAPYDIIYVGTAVPEIPQAIIDQLAPGGRLIMPVGTCDGQVLIQIDKFLDGRLKRKNIMQLICCELLLGSKITPEAIYGSIKR